MNKYMVRYHQHRKDRHAVIHAQTVKQAEDIARGRFISTVAWEDFRIISVTNFDHVTEETRKAWETIE